MTNRLALNRWDSPRYCGVCGGKIAEMQPNSCVGGTPHIPETEMDENGRAPTEVRATPDATDTVQGATTASSEDTTLLLLREADENATLGDIDNWMSYRIRWNAYLAQGGDAA